MGKRLSGEDKVSGKVEEKVEWGREGEWGRDG